MGKNMYSNFNNNSPLSYPLASNNFGNTARSEIPVPPSYSSPMKEKPPEPPLPSVTPSPKFPGNTIRPHGQGEHFSLCACWFHLNVQ